MGKLEVELFQIKEQILRPKAGAFAGGRRLCRLEMRVGECRHIAIFFGEVGHGGDGIDQKGLDLQKRLAHDDDVRIVADVAARRAQMNDRARAGAGVAVGVNVAHDVVAQLRFIARRAFVVDIVHMRAKFVDLFLRHGKTEFMFRLGQSDPEPPPGGELHVVGENMTHFFARIARAQRACVIIVHETSALSNTQKAKARPFAPSYQVLIR